MFALGPELVCHYSACLMPSTHVLCSLLRFVLIELTARCEPEHVKQRDARSTYSFLIRTYPSCHNNS